MHNHVTKVAFLLLLIFTCTDILAQTNQGNRQVNDTAIEQWTVFESTLKGPSTGNPFVDVELAAEFTNGSKKISVTGFYDGDGNYKIRFMPETPGIWSYRTSSNTKSLTNKTGQFNCTPATAANHGPVKVWNTYNFQYANGKPYYPFGTTIYAWTHQSEALQELTLQTLKKAPFNKVRMCVFPKTYSFVEDEPALYAYEEKSRTTKSNGKLKHEWDFTRFNPTFSSI